MRWLGVDPGEARVGLAICDPEERIAVPLEVIPASAAFPAIRSILRREQAGGIVVGLPLLPSGDEGDAAKLARKLGDRLARHLDVPVVYEDERLTSVAAEAQRLTAGAPRGVAIDDLAAALLLEQFLAGRRIADQHTDERADVDAPA
jgi:putative Holliday junction resolvase